MFLGTYEHSIDDKGRVTIPARFRPGLAEGMVITIGLDGCLWVFPMVEWTKFAANMDERLSATRRDARNFERLMFSRATEAKPDGQGRVLIPSRLRDFAKLDKEAVITGLNRRVEIWDPHKWQQVDDEVEADAEAIAENLAELGIL